MASLFRKRRTFLEVQMGLAQADPIERELAISTAKTIAWITGGTIIGWGALIAIAAAETF